MKITYVNESPTAASEEMKKCRTINLSAKQQEI